MRTDTTIPIGWHSRAARTDTAPSLRRQTNRQQRGPRRDESDRTDCDWSTLKFRERKCDDYIALPSYLENADAVKLNADHPLAALSTPITVGSNARCRWPRAVR